MTNGGFTSSGYDYDEDEWVSAASEQSKNGQNKEPAWVTQRRNEYEERQASSRKYAIEIGEGPTYDPWTMSYF